MNHTAPARTKRAMASETVTGREPGLIRRRRWSAAVLTAALAGLCGLPALTPTAADAAATPGVYIVAPKWWGWCPDIGRIKNYVVSVSISSTTTGYSKTDYGDDIGWSTVLLNKNNTIHVNVGCSRGHGSFGTKVTIRPTRNGQTFWVSTGGASYGN